MKQHIQKSGDNSFGYVFNYTDHLGNVRVSYEDMDNDGTIYVPNEILEENNYYPFGLKHQGYNNDLTQTVNKYRYNGKEFQDELGLNHYDYGARNYDPAIGRWMNIDPKADERQMFSPYNYVQNNPIKRIDPTGMLDEWVKDGDAYVWDDRVTDQATAEKHHGSDAKYIGKAATVTSVQGGKTLDSVKLNSDGSVTKNNVTLEAGNHGAFTNAAGSSFQARQTEGSFVGLSANFAFGGGFGFSLGKVTDAVGDSSWFFSANANIGLGADASIDFGTTTPTGNNQFLTTDFAGEGSSYTFGFNTPLGSPSWTTGGSVDQSWGSSDKLSPSKFGTNPGGYKVKQNGLGTFGWGAGAMYTQGTTTLLNK
ncbi:RHS repeat-associated core domain protein [compost metagenome]